MADHILILGTGPTALATALALCTCLPNPKPKITLFELRTSPSTIGGAVNLTPKALRYLHHLGIDFDERGIGAECQTIELFDLYSGSKYAWLDFRGSNGEGIGDVEGERFFARRVMRKDLVGALLGVLEGREGVSIVFGKKVTNIDDSVDGVTLTFENGDIVTGDCLLGCDGIHSAVRSLLVEPERKPTYTGISVAMATSTLKSSVAHPTWTTTGLVSSRRGSLMCSYFQPDKREHYIGAVMEIADVGSREGWKAKGEDQDAIERDLLQRFSSENMPVCEQILKNAGNWTLYPVFALPEGGKWISPAGKCILLGDAAHAMPPQGESTGICIEDAIALCRFMMQHRTKPLCSIFEAYEAFRRPATDAAVREAKWRWETVKDKGWLVYQLIIRSTSWFLWWTARKREKELSEDVSGMAFEIWDSPVSD